MEPLITVKEYAILKGISEVTVRRLIKSGDIQIERFGRAVRIVPEPSGLRGYKPIPRIPRE